MLPKTFTLARVSFFGLMRFCRMIFASVLILFGLLALTVSSSGADDTVNGTLTGNTGQISGNVNTSALQITGYLVDSNGTIYSLPAGSNPQFSNLTTSNATLIEGNLYAGYSTTFGTWSDGVSIWNGTLINSYYGYTDIIGASSKVNWSWQKDGIGTATNQMTLNGDGNLTFFDSVSGNNFAIIPANSSLVVNWFNGTNGTEVISLATLAFNHDTFSGGSSGGNLSLGGGGLLFDANNTSPSGQVIHIGSGNISSSPSNGMVITDGNTSNSINFMPTASSAGIGFSNGATMAASGGRIMLGNTTPNFSIGNATVSGCYTYAIGDGASAISIGAIAVMGNSTASGAYTVAIGNTSTASGNYAVALGGGNATAVSAIAIGVGTIAQTWATVVVGHYNAPISGNTTAWQSTDPAFIVGVGTSTTPANGLVAYNSGNVTFGGNLSLNNPAYVSPTNATQPQELLIQGATNVNGTATFNGNATLSIPIQNGEISMGAFAH